MITPEEIDTGLRAYEQVQAFASLRRKRLPVIYGGFTVLLLAMGIVAALQASPILTSVCVGGAIGFAIFAPWNWRRLRALDVLNRALLANLRVKHGDNLPWLEVERQQAAIREIQAEQR